MASTSPPEDAPPEDAPPADKDDELHRRFREALDRKRKVGATGGAASGDEQGGKLHGSTGPAKQQRTFRRKSGG